MTRSLVSATGLSLCAAGDPGDAAAPDWVQLTPGREVVGRDGRAWRLDDPGAVVERHRRDGVDLVVDIEHATQVKGERGDPAPAVGWIKALEVRDGGAIWGRVAWLDEGRAAVESRRYRYLSPVFGARAGEVVRLVSAGLTNVPNLTLAALNREEETRMDELKSLARAAGLAETAGAGEIETAINRLREQPDAARFAPRADLEQALNRAQAAEERLARIERERAEAEIAAVVDGAIAAGKIAPASRGFYLAACRDAAQRQAFEALVASAAPIVGPAGDAKKPGGAAAALTPEETLVANAMGIDHAEFAKLKGEAA